MALAGPKVAWKHRSTVTPFSHPILLLALFEKEKKKKVNIMAAVSVYVTLSFSQCAAVVSTWIIPVAI